MSNPANLKYSREHEWMTDIDEDVNVSISAIGMTRYGVDQLGLIKYVQLPAVGDKLAVGDRCGVVASARHAQDIVSPVSGMVVQSNEFVTANPGLLNEHPFDDAWLFKVEVTAVAGELLTVEQYDQLTDGED